MILDDTPDCFQNATVECSACKFCKYGNACWSKKGDTQ